MSGSPFSPISGIFVLELSSDEELVEDVDSSARYLSKGEKRQFTNEVARRKQQEFLQGEELRLPETKV